MATPETVDSAPIIAELVQNLRRQLHSPINHIVGLSEILIEEAEETGRTSLVPDLLRVRDAGGTINRQVNNVFNVDRMESGDFDPASVCQDLRTTLDAVMGYCEMLGEDATNAGWSDTVTDLKCIEFAGSQLMGFIDPLLDLAAMLATSRAAGGSTALQTPVGWTRLMACAPEYAGRLLVVDDSEMDREVLSRRLLRLGHHVHAVGDAFAALEELKQNEYDLVLCEVMLPEMTGSDLIEEMKASETLRDIPVIVVSNIDAIDWVAKCIELGAEDFLPKPFDPVLLKARLDASLEKGRLRAKEMEYLRAAQHVAAAAEALEATSFEADSLNDVAARDDSLGHLARVFQRMAREVVAREQRLRAEVQQLRIEIDSKQAEREVADITGTDFFRDLQAKAHRLRGESPSA